MKSVSSFCKRSCRADGCDFRCRDGRADDLGAGLQCRDGKLDQRRAGIGRQQVRLFLNLIGHEGTDGRMGLEAAVRAVEDLDPGALSALEKG